MTAETPEIAWELLERASAGQQMALESLTEAVYPHVRRWCLVQTGNEADADDLTQDVLVRMIRKLDGYRGGARFTSWLYRITRNAAADWRRGRRRRDRSERHPRTVEGLTPSRPAAPDRAAERAELSTGLLALFGELPARQREVFDLAELQGVSVTEVAERLAIEPVTVRAHLFKARRKMRKRLLATHPELAEYLP